MVTSSLTQLSSDINGQIEYCDKLDTKLQQAEALARVAEAADFDQLSNSAIHHYMLTFTELIEQGEQITTYLAAKLCDFAERVEALAEKPDKTNISDKSDKPKSSP